MIEWLVQRAVDDPQVAAGLPPAALLSPPETAVFAHLHNSKRRKDWLLGRWTAKNLVQAAAVKTGQRAPSWHEISILAAKDGAPEVWFSDRDKLDRGNYSLSISHSHGVSLCAAVSSRAYLVGADIEAIEPRPPRFINDYFSAYEIELVKQSPEVDKNALITAIWSGKEAVLKAVRQGLRVDTRAVTCTFGTPLDTRDEWHPFDVQFRSPQGEGPALRINGHYRLRQQFVLTLVVAADCDYLEYRQGRYLD